MVELLTRKLDGILLGIKLKTKTLTDAQPFLERMKKANPLLASDYENKLYSALGGRK